MKDKEGEDTALKSWGEKTTRTKERTVLWGYSKYEEPLRACPEQDLNPKWTFETWENLDTWY